MKTEEEFKNIRDKVRGILMDYPEVRERSPFRTIIYMWRDYDGLPNWIATLLLDYHEKHSLSDTETIRRSRQLIQNETLERIGQCKNQIKKWTTAGDNQKIKEWNNRLKEAEKMKLAMPSKKSRIQREQREKEIKRIVRE